MKQIYNYLTTNIITLKQYVGAHIGELDDSYLGSGIYLFSAIKKYGRQNFIKEVLEICDNIDIAHENEEKFIKEYNTLVPNGYNISPKGGIGYNSNTGLIPWNKGKKGLQVSAFKGKKHSEESKQKMRKPKINTDKMKKPKTEEHKKHLSENNGSRRADVKKKLSNAAKLRIGNKNGFFGKHHLQETKDKISNSLKNK